MPCLEWFEEALTAAERRLLSRLSRPGRIQEFLDELSYRCVDAYACPLRTLRERTGHCFDGAVLAAAVLHHHGEPAWLVDLIPNGRDDDHVVTLYRRHGHWGAIAKSNFVGLRFREAIFRSPRELVLSYFELYYNTAREKTLAGYTKPLPIRRFDHLPWITEDPPLYDIADALDAQPRYHLLTAAMARGLEPVDRRSYQAGLQGSNARGLYRAR